MENYYFKKWCEEAVSGIVFPPDRDKVGWELMNHMEDHYDYLIEQGYDPKTARQMTVEAMGDAAQIAPQLAAIHRPFWGYFLRVTRVILIVLLVIMVIPFVRHVWNTTYSEPTVYRFDPYRDTYLSDEIGVTKRILYTEPGQTVQSDGYTLTLTQVAWTQTDSEDQIGRSDYFGFRIEVFNPIPWAKRPEIKDWLWAEDDLGNLYCPGDPDRYLSGNVYHSGPATWLLDMWIPNFCSPDARWIEIHYDRDGRDLSFRIDLTGGVSP